MSQTGRTPGQVIMDALIDAGLERGVVDWTREVHEALLAEGWIRSPAERLDALLSRSERE